MIHFIARIHHQARWIWGAIALFCALSMAYALYAEHILDLEPCNLCMLQRGSMVALGVVCFIAFIHNAQQKIWRVTYALMAELAALSGLLVAGRHVWLQHLPADQIPACGPSFDYLVSQFPITEVIQEIFTGSGSCAEIKWQFVGFSMPEIVLALFIVFFLICQLQLIAALYPFKKSSNRDKLKSARLG